jgi:hypothetical protein
MLETLAVLLLLIFGAILLLAAVVALPLMLLAVLFKFLFFMIMLPLKLIKFFVTTFFGILAGLGKLVLFILAPVIAVVLLVAGAVILPFLAFALICGGIWLLLRLFLPAPTPA